MTLSIEEMIQNIATQNGVVLDRHDPVLLLQTMMDHLWKESQQAQEASRQQYKEEWQGFVAQWDEETKAKTEHVLNAILTATQEALAQTLVDGTAVLRQEIQAALQHITAQRQAIQTLSQWNVAASALTLLATGVVAWIALGP